VFTQNEANAGGGIYSISSNITFTDDSSITFAENSVQTDGRSVFLISNSNVSFGRNSMISFTNNVARGNGGAMYLGSNSNFRKPLGIV